MAVGIVLIAIAGVRFVRTTRLLDRHLVHRFLGTNHLGWIHVIHDDLYPGL